jgi:hypothetical protein
MKRSLTAVVAILSMLAWWASPASARGAGPLAGSASSRAVGSLTWSTPVATDHEPPALYNRLASVSCPRSSLCVAGDNTGDVLVSTDPTGGYAAWRTFHIDSTRTVYGTTTLSVSCASSSLCLAGDGNGNVLVSSNPTGGSSAWKAVHVSPSAIGSGGCDSGLVCGGTTCVAPSLCLAVDGFGNVITSTDPTAGAGKWMASNLSPDAVLSAVTCASGSLCVAFGFTHTSTGTVVGELFTSTDPIGGAGAWRLVQLPGTYGLEGGSCPSASLCVAFDNNGDLISSSDPTGGAGAWQLARVDPDPVVGLSCPSASLCVAVDADGRILTSTDPSGGPGAWTITGVSHIITATTPFTGVSCPSTSFCAAVDSDANAVTSTDPAGGAGSWAAAHIKGGNPLVAISCPSESFCGALDSDGFILTARHPATAAGKWAAASGVGDTDISCPTASLCASTGTDGVIATSTNPGDGSNTWVTDATLPSSQSFGLSTYSPATSISCPSAALCVAVGHGAACGVGCFPSGPGYVATTTNPAGGPAAWSAGVLPGVGALTGVSCSLSGLCVAIDDSGDIASSTRPSAGPAEWHVVHVAASLDAISCASSSLCVVVAQAGDALISTNPTGGPGTWRPVHLSSTPLTDVTCRSRSLCVAVGGTRAFVSARPTHSASAWVSTDIESSAPAGSLTAISCASLLLCIATDDAGRTILGSAPSQAQIQMLLAPQITPRRELAAKRLLRKHSYVLAVTAPTAGSLRIAWYATQPKNTGIAGARILIAAGRRQFAGAVSAGIKLQVTRAGADVLKHAGHIRITSTATFIAPHRRATSVTATFTLT